MAEFKDDWIHLRSISFPCVLGLLEWEQRQTQALGLEVSLNLDLDRAAGGDLSTSVNYAQTLEDLQFIAQHGRWRLLESMAAAMARQVLASPEPEEGRAQVEQIILRISKPEVFGGRAIPFVEIRRPKDWSHLNYIAGAEPGVSMATLQFTADSGAYRIRVEPQAKWTVPPGMSLRVLTGGLQEGDALHRVGECLGRGGHVIWNSGTKTCCLLGVSQPPVGMPA
jgi:FolB domain-containing protein